ncbi:unnamed protein product [Symbiodinium natans]|uniref:Uncharacterized protein n=1 Tax=Symbiodinium natans TaxID=878477 RepID=A0A812JBR6_9DINO|nr:unnamed protein product [Symbiodinium natans]
MTRYMRQFEKFQLADLDSYFEEAYAQAPEGSWFSCFRHFRTRVMMVVNFKTPEESGWANSQSEAWFFIHVDAEVSPCFHGVGRCMASAPLCTCSWESRDGGLVLEGFSGSRTEELHQPGSAGQRRIAQGRSPLQPYELSSSIPGWTCMPGRTFATAGPRFGHAYPDSQRIVLSGSMAVTLC